MQVMRHSDGIIVTDAGHAPLKFSTFASFHVFFLSFLSSPLYFTFFLLSPFLYFLLDQISCFIVDPKNIFAACLKQEEEEKEKMEEEEANFTELRSNLFPLYWFLCCPRFLFGEEASDQSVLQIIIISFPSLHESLPLLSLYPPPFTSAPEDVSTIYGRPVTTHKDIQRSVDYIDQ